MALKTHNSFTCVDAVGCGLSVRALVSCDLLPTLSEREEISIDYKCSAKRDEQPYKMIISMSQKLSAHVETNVAFII